MRPTIRLLAGLALVPVLAACSGGGAAASATPPAGTDLTVSAQVSAFSVDTITIPTGRPFTVFFRNLDGMPHNIAIYTDGSASRAVFVGDTITDAAVAYKVPPLEPGTYYFRCDVHPGMQGTVDVPSGSS